MNGDELAAWLLERSKHISQREREALRREYWEQRRRALSYPVDELLSFFDKYRKDDKAVGGKKAA